MSLLTLNSDLPQYAQADFPILVKVWVEPDHAPSCRQEPHSWWVVGVSWGEAEDEMKETPFVGGVKWPSYDNVKLHNVYKTRVDV